MASKKHGHWPLVLGTVLILSGCVQGGAGGSDENAPANSGGRPSASDIEAPGQFSANDRGLWDGRPSLGGVWIAMSDVTSPRRVLIRNAENGKSTVGALFRRERENPGPRIQISSDAADRLGILAGQPTQLSVVALTREEPVETAPHLSDESTGAAAETTAETEAQPAPAEGSPEAVAAAAAAAIAETGVEPQPTPETRSPSSFGRRSQPAPAPLPAETAEGDPAAAGAAAAEPQPVPEDASPSSFGRRSARRPAAEAPSDIAATASPGDVTTQPLDATGVAPAPAQTTAPAQATAPAAATAPADGAALQSYVQAGTFTTEANAQAAAGALTAGGLQASVRSQAGASGTFWIVLVGPANTRAERNRTLEKVKGMGYPDAFVVRG